MKRRVLAFLCALVLVISAFTSFACAARPAMHDRYGFTATDSAFLKEFKRLLEYNKCYFTMDLVEDFSDSNAKYYDMYGEDGEYAMTIVLYTDNKTRILETIRFYCEEESFSKLGEGKRLFGLKVAFLTVNPNLDDDTWEEMFSKDTWSDDGYVKGYFGEFDHVSYSLTIQDENYVEFSIT